jgi:outer membrane immunogenic protein
LVFGVEGDVSFANVEGSVLSAGIVPCFVEGCTARLSWLGTARARLGFGGRDLLPYITGGAAVGHVAGSADNGGCSSPPIGPPCSYDETRWGWTAGGGVEFRLGRGWSAKVEYLYVNLGTPTFSAPPATSSNFAFSVVRGGLNFHF